MSGATKVEPVSLLRRPGPDPGRGFFDKLIMQRETYGGWVYIMANRYRGKLYIGVTSDLAARVTQPVVKKVRSIAQNTGLPASCGPGSPNRLHRPSNTRSGSNAGDAHGSST